MTELKGILNKWWGNLEDGKGFFPGRIPNLWRFLVLLGGGVALLIFAGSLINPATSTTSPPAPVRQKVQRDDSLTAAEKELEARLEKVLGSVAGAGSVQVTVTLASGQENVFAQNVNKQNRITEEKDQAGGNRKTTEVNEQGSLVFGETLNGGKDDPVLIKAKRPEIAGVLVLAEGAKDPELREKLAQAVEILLDVPPHKVTVLAKESW